MKEKKRQKLNKLFVVFVYGLSNKVPWLKGEYIGITNLCLIHNKYFIIHKQCKLFLKFSNIFDMLILYHFMQFSPRAAILNSINSFLYKKTTSNQIYEVNITIY